MDAHTAEDIYLQSSLLHSIYAPAGALVYYSWGFFQDPKRMVTASLLSVCEGDLTNFAMIHNSVSGEKMLAGLCSLP